MLIKYIHDGDLCDESLKESSFQFNNDKDFRRSYRKDEYSEETPEYDLRIAFVGFVISDDSILVSLPKGYILKEENDLKNIFKLIKTFSQIRPDLQMGKLRSKVFETNYPFEAFYKIYDYYLNYGLFLEKKFKLLEGLCGKVNWKKTITKSKKIIINNDIIMYPYYSQVKIHYLDFISFAMHFAINSTINKMNFLLDVPLLEDLKYDLTIFQNPFYVVDALYTIKEKIYNDRVNKLIDVLISFYKKIKSGKEYYLKHYYFSSIWEEITRKYIYDKCIGYNSSGIVLGLKGLNFCKKTFHPNAANKKNYISIDCYAENSKQQYIFDAKYYEDIDTINYKQVGYSMMLKDLVDAGGIKKYSETFSVLLLPGNSYKHNIHFQLDTGFGTVNEDVIIYIDYLDVHEIIDYYMSEK